MRLEMVKKIKLLGFLTAAVFIYISVYANARINSVTMVPANPNFGQAITVTIDYCAQLYNDNWMAMAISTSSAFQSAALSGVGQIFVISNRGVDVPVAVPATSPGGRIDWRANTQNGWIASPPCTDCSGNGGQNYTQTYVVHVPPSQYFPGCNNTNLYLLVGMKDANLNEGEWQNLPSTCGGLYP
jgi:hypothetical protein